MVVEDAGQQSGGSDHYEFLETVVRHIDGWLEDVACLRTMDLLDFQESRGLSGPLMEIGVYAGKYFSVLLRASRRVGSKVVGIDVFQYRSVAEVRATLAPLVARCSAPPVLVEQRSIACTPASLLELMGAPARFVSIDGSHERDDVTNDLWLAEHVLGDEGIVAVDDFLNPITPGVNEAVHAFFGEIRKEGAELLTIAERVLPPRVARSRLLSRDVPEILRRVAPRLPAPLDRRLSRALGDRPRLVPFGYLANKLFLARPSWAPRYRSHLETVVTSDTRERSSQRFRDRASEWRGLIEVSYFGHPVLVVPD